MHEFGHQYWQSMVASNEFEESWLDEGFNSYSTGKVMDRVYGPWMLQVLGLRLGGLELSRVQNSVERMFDRIRTPAWGFSSGSNYGFNSYARTELTLLTLGALVGEETLARAMRTYHERFRFRHPTSDDFYAVVSEVARRDLSGFFAQTTERPGILDDEVSSVRRKIDEPLGVFARATRKSVTKKEAREKEKQADAAGGRRWRTTVMVRRRGGWCCRRRCGSTTRAARRGRCRSSRRMAPASNRDPRRRERRAVARALQEDRAHDGQACLRHGGSRPAEADVSRVSNARRASRMGAASRWGTRLVFWLQQLLALAGL